MHRHNHSLTHTHALSLSLCVSLSLSLSLCLSLSLSHTHTHTLSHTQTHKHTHTCALSHTHLKSQPFNAGMASKWLQQVAAVLSLVPLKKEDPPAAAPHQHQHQHLHLSRQQQLLQRARSTPDKVTSPSIPAVRPGQRLAANLFKVCRPLISSCNRPLSTSPCFS